MPEQCFFHGDGVESDQNAFAVFSRGQVSGVDIQTGEIFHDIAQRDEPGEYCKIDFEGGKLFPQFIGPEFPDSQSLFRAHGCGFQAVRMIKFPDVQQDQGKTVLFCQTGRGRIVPVRYDNGRRPCRSRLLPVKCQYVSGIAAGPAEKNRGPEGQSIIFFQKIP